jgi:hypothetical protein
MQNHSRLLRRCDFPEIQSPGHFPRSVEWKPDAPAKGNDGRELRWRVRLPSSHESSGLENEPLRNLGQDGQPHWFPSRPCHRSQAGIGLVELVVAQSTVQSALQ